jgi:hypothetical protein
VERPRAPSTPANRLSIGISGMSVECGGNYFNDQHQFIRQKTKRSEENQWQTPEVKVCHCYVKQYAGLKTVPKYADWFDAFDALEEHLSNLPAK